VSFAEKPISSVESEKIKQIENEICLVLIDRMGELLLKEKGYDRGVAGVSCSGREWASYREDSRQASRNNYRSMRNGGCKIAT
jgi:hypothetical protein